MFVSHAESKVREKLVDLEWSIRNCEGYGDKVNSCFDPYSPMSHSDAHDYCFIRIEWRNFLKSLIGE